MNDWYHVQFGELEGYVPAEEISTSPIEEEPAPETPAPEPEADGTECFFEVDGGSFAYYELQYSVFLDNDEMVSNTVNTSDSVYRLGAGSSPVPQSARATVTPYDNDGNPGTPFTCSGSISDLVVREFTPAEREKG